MRRTSDVVAGTCGLGRGDARSGSLVAVPVHR